MYFFERDVRSERYVYLSLYLAFHESNILDFLFETFEPHGGQSFQSLVARVDFDTHLVQGGDTQQRFGIRLAE